MNKPLQAQTALLFCVLSLGTIQPLFAGWKDTLLSLIGSQEAKKQRHRQRSPEPVRKAPTRSLTHAGNKFDYGAYTMTHEQAQNYIENVIASFEFELRPHLKNRQLARLSFLIKDTVQKEDRIKLNGPQGVRYDKNRIDEYIASGIALYIEQTSYHYALKATRNSDIAVRIAESMRNNALALIDKRSYLDAEMLVPFIGKSLKTAVKLIAKQTNNNPMWPLNVETNEKPQKLYPSSECCICFEDFDEATIERIFLTPCGHDLCKMCAHQLFLTEGHPPKRVCPKCRTEINVQALAREMRSAYACV